MVYANILRTLLLAPLVSAAGLYPQGSSVLQVDAKNYNNLIAKSNYTSILEFYAPWCGHCQNLKPQYEKAAASLDGIAKVAAINCDEDENKPFCGNMGIQGFPTLKIVKPSKKAGGRPVVEDYQGARTTKAIREAVLEKMPNHVTRLKEDSFKEWLENDANKPKALIFSDKSTVSPLIKAIAIDFLDALAVGQIRSTDKKLVKRFGVETFPTVLLLPEGNEDKQVTFDGEVKKDQLIGFLSQAASPNPAATPPDTKGKKKSSEKVKKDTKEKKTGKNAEKPRPAPEEPAEGDSPVQSSDPVHSEPAPKLTSLVTEDALQKACIHTKSSTCVLALVAQATEGEERQEPARTLLSSLAEIAHKHSQRGAKVFPCYEVTGTDVVGTLVASLGVKTSEEGVAIIAINAKRGWWQQYVGGEFNQAAVETWIDTIRFGEGSKMSIPDGLVVKVEEDFREHEPPKSAEGTQPKQNVDEEMSESEEDEETHDEL